MIGVLAPMAVPAIWWRVIKVVAVVAVIGFACWKVYDWGFDNGTLKIQSEWDTERAARSQELANAQARLREMEGQLAVAAADTRKVTNEQVRVLVAQRDALVERVRNAQRRLSARVSGPTPATSDGKIGAGDPGTWILATIGEQDVDEALRADVIRLELLACYAQYERAEAALNQAGNKK